MKESTSKKDHNYKEAIILVGGLGSRLEEKVREMPKPMLQVKGKPFLEWLLLDLKIKGFNFESTHMTVPARIDKLLAVMTIAFAWSYRAGEIFSDVEPIAIKSHGDKAKSYFRHGYLSFRNIKSQKYYF